MSGSGGFAVSRSHGGDRFYNPPMRRQQQQSQQLLQLQRATKSESAVTAVLTDAGNRTDSDDSASALSKPGSIRSPSPPMPPDTNLTNLDRFLESVTPFVTASEVSNPEQDPSAYYIPAMVFEDNAKNLLRKIDFSFH